MGFKEITYNNKPLYLHKALITPDFDHKTVIVNDYWEYIEMWLKRMGEKDAISYWNQARSFYNASLTIPIQAAPLTLYYCFLNATKTFLMVKHLPFREAHGATGQIQPGHTNLKNEQVTFKSSGILASLSCYFNEPRTPNVYSLKDLLYNLPFVHRSFNLTFLSGDYPELYIPVLNPRFVIKEKSHEAWFCADLTKQHSNSHSLKKLSPLGYERDLGVPDSFTIRKRQRFNWYLSREKKISNLTRLGSYHKKIRSNLQYIVGNSTLWYIKRPGPPHCLDRNPLTIILASMHRLSELARYQPPVLERHFDLKQNWLLSEFIKGSAAEFIDQLVCEMTNQDFMFRSHRRGR